MPFEPTLESLRTHEVPAWFHDAKLGIFVHWSVSSVPAFAPRGAGIEAIFRGDAGQTESPYAEWYENSLRLPGSAVARHHREHHGDRPYESFAEDFRAGLEAWDPKAWARAFAASGARYVVLVTKHHDGFCLWPSRVPHPDPRRHGWHTGRDVVGELADAVRSEGLRFGVYYSGGLDWTFEPRPIRGLVDTLASMPGGPYSAYADAQVRELVERYRPEVLWNDISWPSRAGALWPLLAHYLNRVPEGVVNDRWQTRNPLVPLLRVPGLRGLAERLTVAWLRRRGGIAGLPAPPFCDFRTPEYASFPDIRRKKWECVRGMDKSFGYNRASLPDDFIGREELLHGLVDIVSKNGNLMLNVGPRGEDATIPEIQLERLRWLGELMREAGEALQGTRPWRRAEGTTREGVPVRFTRKGDDLYALLLDATDAATLTLEDVAVPAGTALAELGTPEPPRWEREGTGVRVTLAPRPRGSVTALALPGAAGPD